MTMTRSEQLKHGPEEKGFRNFREKIDLNITAPELEQQPDVQWELFENHYSQYSELPGRMEKHKDHHSEKAQQHGEQEPQTNTPEGCVDHLLILAQSAEIVAQSEDSVAGMHTNNQNKGSHNNLVDQMTQAYANNITADDQGCSRELLDRFFEDYHVSSQGCGFCYEVTRPRLTKIRKQARCKYLILDEEKIKGNQCKRLQGKTVRLSQIKHQARCKSKNDLLPQEIITGHRNELQGRIIRLSQMKHQARSKGNSIAKEGTEEHMDGSLHCNKFKDSNFSVVEGVPANKFFRGACQSSVVRQGDENLREQQRTARRIRAFKTKKLRRQLRTEWISNSAKKRVHDTKISSIGLAEKIQGHLGSNQSSGLRCKYHQHIPSRVPVQNDILNTSFARSPNNIFQQCDANMGWMLYMHHMQRKEYHRFVARQHRAERIEEKRASKDKHQKSKNPVQTNSEAQKEFMPVKRLRLTQLRREVRLGNQCSVMQRHAEN